MYLNDFRMNLVPPLFPGLSAHGPLRGSCDNGALTSEGTVSPSRRKDSPLRSVGQCLETHILREGLVKANQPAVWPQTVLPCPGLTLDNSPDTLG